MSLLAGSFVVLMIGALLSLLLARYARASLLAAVLAILGASVGYTLAALAALLTPTPASLTLCWLFPLGSASMVLDPLAAWFLLVIAILSIAVALYLWAYMRAAHVAGSHATAAFGALLCLLVAMLGLVVCAAEVMLFLVAWELMTLAAFFLILFHDQDPAVRRGAWMYLIATHLGTTLCLLPMFAILVSLGGWQFAGFLAALSAAPALKGAIFVLGLIGFGTKAGFMPVHVWLPNAHPVAPTPVSALLSGVVVKTGIYGILRLLMWLGDLPPSYSVVLLAVGIVSGILGVLYALAQHDIKRLLAYHTIENIGIIGIGIGLGMLGQATGHSVLTVLGYAGALLHVLNHALFKGLLFLSAGAVIQATGTGDIDRLGGLARKTPPNAALFLLAALAICGLPPLNGFISEFLIYAGLFTAAGGLSAALAGASVAGLVGLALMGGLALACFAKVFSVVFLGEPREAALLAHKTPVAMLSGMLVLAVLCLAIGIAPALALPLLTPAVKALAVLSDAQFPPDLHSYLGPASMLAVLTALLAGIIVGLVLLRRWGGAGQPVITAASGRVPTWGCGYPYPSGRIQYTASSFAWSLITSFRSLLWAYRKVSWPGGVFPGGSRLATHAPDLAENDLFAPLFRGVARMAGMARTFTWSGRDQDMNQPPALNAAERPFRALLENFRAGIQRGNIQMCVTYIGIILVLVFALDAFFLPGAHGASRSPATQPVRNPGAMVP